MEIQKDDLTGFFLRKTLYTFLEKLIIDASLNKKSFSVVLLDLDRLKKYNDKYGHPFGDEILKYMSSIIRLSFMGSPSHYFRYGGDEFIVLLPEKDAKQALQTAAQFKYNMAHRPFLFNDNFFKITTSVGIASFPHDGQTIDQLIRKADEAMYFSKRHGRNQATLASKIKLLRLKGMMLVAVSACVIFQVILILSKYVFEYKIVRNFVEKVTSFVTNISITTTPTTPNHVFQKGKKIDVIILRNGTILKGKILEETDTKIIFSPSMLDGSASLTYLKSQIAEIKYDAEDAPD